MSARLALHAWSLDATPLADILRVARATGWEGVELRRADFDRAAEAGQPAEAVVDLVRASGLAPGHVLDRLPSGRGIVPFASFLAALAEKGYGGWISCAAPNAEAWGRAPADGAAEALAATRSFLDRPKASASSA